MKNSMTLSRLLLCSVVIVIFLAVGGFPQQRLIAKVPDPRIELGRGMSLLTPDLMQIAAKSNLFLNFADRLNLTKEQRKKLEDLFFEVQQYQVRREADLNVVDAELQRILADDRVDLRAVRSKVKELEAIQTEATVKKIEWVLASINALTHEQHLQVMLFAREGLEQRSNSN